MAYKVIILYRLYMPSYFLGTFTEYPYVNIGKGGKGNISYRSLEDIKGHKKSLNAFACQTFNSLECCSKLFSYYCCRINCC